jgi:outer membrane lipoprotein-sorting protein
MNMTCPSWSRYRKVASSNLVGARLFRVTALSACLACVASPTPAAPQAPDPSRPATLQGAVAATGPSPAVKPEEPPTDSEREIDLAIDKIAKLESFAADLDQTVEMLSQKFSIKGRALKAPNSRVYLKLTVSGLTDTAGTTLQVSDGDVLWDYEQILDGQFYHKYSVKPILERLANPDLDARIKEQVRNQLGFAGPESLLLGLRKIIKFEQKKEAGELQGKKVWIFRGTWKSRQGLMTADAKPVGQLGVLPAYIPMDAVLYVGQDDGWPYKLVLAGRQATDLQDTRKVGPDGRPIGAKASIERPSPTRIELIYSNVKLNVLVKPDEFAFTAPPTATVDDNTELILKGLDQVIRNQIDKKKAESTKKDGPILDQEIPIPQPAAAPASKPE